jgi:putative ABC transport system substrate-binding protein
MKRRDFITLLGAASAWPLAARAQQPAMPVVGFLSARSPGETAPAVALFRTGLAKAGYVEGQNLAIEYRWAEGRYEQLPALAADLVRRRVAVIVATGGEVAASAAQAATSTIPIVFTSGGDPVNLGLVKSLNRPGGNATGVSLFFGLFAPKRLELLQQLVPKAAVFGVLVNPGFPSAEQEKKDMLEAERTLGRQIYFMTASTEVEIDGAFRTLIERRVDALVVSTDAFFISRRRQLIALAAHHAVPVMYFAHEFPADGGLMSYGTNIADAYRQLGDYTARILNSAKPADLPVVQPTKFELVINLNTARALGLEIPAQLLSLADEVIE